MESRSGRRTPSMPRKRPREGSDGPQSEREQIDHDSGTGSSEQEAPASTSGSSMSASGSNMYNPSSKRQRRFSWSEDNHRDFVSAIFDIGLKNSSPSALLEQMGNCYGMGQAVTIERIKSHLQKYRLNREKSKREFLDAYDGAMERYSECADGQQTSQTMRSGEVAAFLTREAMGDGKPRPAVATVVGAGAGATAGVAALAASLAPPPDLGPGGGTLFLPSMTEDELRTPLGQSIQYLVGLFHSMNQQLQQRRASEVVTGAAAPPTALAPLAGVAAVGTTSSTVTSSTVWPIDPAIVPQPPQPYRGISASGVAQHTVPITPAPNLVQPLPGVGIGVGVGSASAGAGCQHLVAGRMAVMQMAAAVNQSEETQPGHENESPSKDAPLC